MIRSNHYEAAFEAWLREQGLSWIAVDETRRYELADGEGLVKSLDFLVHGPYGARLLIDVKGRRFPGGPPDRPRRVWESWTATEDVDGLVRWTASFGPGYRGLFVFAYHVLPCVELPDDTVDLFCWQGKRYLYRAIDVDDYRLHVRGRSPKWDTICLSRNAFLRLARPVSEFTNAAVDLSEELIGTMHDE